MTRLDGNVLAGPLSELFAVDVTCARGRCVQCGDRAVLAEALVYVSRMGTIARCRRCSNVLLSFVGTPEIQSISMSGLALVEFRRNDR